MNAQFPCVPTRTASFPMPERYRIDFAAALPPGARRRYTLGERSVAAFNVGGRLFAIDDRCPHRGGELSAGAVIDGCVVCPLHGWRFELATGECPDRAGERIHTYSLFAAGEDLFLELDEPGGGDSDAAADGICRYLVRYGAPGWVGRFGSIEPIACAVGDRVVVATPRGIEVGEVLALAPKEGPAGALAGQPAGEVLRPLASGEPLPEEPVAIFEAARAWAGERGLPLEFVDCERLFDGETVALYYVGDPDGRLDDLRVELARAHATAIRCEPLLDPPPRAGGCGKEGCGGGGCAAN